MRKTLPILAAVAACASAFPAAAVPDRLTHATPGTTYFNRPGADLAQHNADIAACSVTAPVQIKAQGAKTLGGAMRGGVFKGILAAATNQDDDTSASQPNIENCMVVRGWRVVDAPAGLERDTPPAELALKLKDLVGAEPPADSIRRAWRNDAAVGEAKGPQTTPDTRSAKSLSFRVQPPATGAASTPALPAMPKSADPPKPLAASRLATIPTDSAVVIVRVKGQYADLGQYVTFVRAGPAPETPAWVADGRPDAISVRPNQLKDSRGPTIPGATEWESVVAFAVPPGRWRLAGVGSGPGALNLDFCFGAPAFDIKAGEAVFAGGFDMMGKAFGPDMSLDGVRGLMAGKLRPASWSNGWTAACRGEHFYALEVAGAPYAPGYAFGGAAKGK